MKYLCLWNWRVLDRVMLLIKQLIATVFGLIGILPRRVGVRYGGQVD